MEMNANRTAQAAQASGSSPGAGDDSLAFKVIRETG
jgi:hypothetical protein